MEELDFKQRIKQKYELRLKEEKEAYDKYMRQFTLYNAENDEGRKALLNITLEKLKDEWNDAYDKYNKVHNIMLALEEDIDSL